MFVLKRNGVREDVSFDKITARIRLLCAGLDVDPVLIAQETIQSLYSGITTSQLDEIAAERAYAHAIANPDYAILAVRLIVSNLHKSTAATFSAATAGVASRAPKRLSPRHTAWIAAHAGALDALIDDAADYAYDYFGISTLLRTYLIRIDGVVCDRPQYMYMRVAVALYIDDTCDDATRMSRIAECYTGLSKHYYTHATPTLINACTTTSQVNSCFLFGMNDNIESIMGTVCDVSLTSKAAGGIGLHASKIRAAGSTIATTGGRACGVPRQLTIFNECVKAWNQGGTRMGAMAAYLEIWHADVMEFVRLKMPGGHATHAPDLFYAIWNCNLFMQRLEANQQWSLFSEDTAPYLSDMFDGMHVCDVCGHCPTPTYADCVAHVWPERVNPTAIRCDQCTYSLRDVFTELYCEYERRGLARRTIDPNDIIKEIAKCASLTGVPYMCHKDHVNMASAQMNLGTVHGSNLCTEIMEVTTDDTIACCALASLNLTEMVDITHSTSPTAGINYARIEETVANCVRNLDRSIDINNYPVERCKPNAYSWRPIGIGVQGLANMFARLRVPFLSPAAELYDMMIFETIYYAALTASVALAREHGPYSGWESSPAARGMLRQDLWRVAARYRKTHIEPFDSGRYNWDQLRADIARYGLRHSLHIAVMPTASTAQILGNNESIEPFSALIYAKSVIGGKQTVINADVIRELRVAGCWDVATQAKVTNSGSIADITGCPENVREIYRTVWELPQKALIMRAARRQQFIDQAQSLNIHLSARDGAPSVDLMAIEACFAFAWSCGLPTGSYYIRTRAAVKPIETNIVALKSVAATPVPTAPALTTPTGSDAKPETDGDVCRPGCDSCSG